MLIAPRESRLTDEMNIPTESDRNNVTTNTSVTRQNSPTVMPPINSGNAITGTTARNVQNE